MHRLATIHSVTDNRQTEACRISATVRYVGCTVGSWEPIPHRAAAPY